MTISMTTKMTLRLPLRALAAACIIACAPLSTAQAALATADASHAPAPSRAQAQLDKLADVYYDGMARFDPVGATENGDSRFNDRIGMSIAPAARARQFAFYAGVQAKLKAIDRAQLDARAQVNYDILDYELRSALSMAPFPSICCRSTRWTACP